MNRIISLFLGVLAYLFFLAVTLELLSFLGVLWPRAAEPSPRPWGEALALNLGLMALFGLQHSVMARPAFKRFVTRFVPEHVERSCYVFATVIALGALLIFWSDMPRVVWDFSGSSMEVPLRVVAFAGFAAVLYATFLIDHFELFGLKQTWAYFRGQAMRRKSFMTPSLYRFVRHPIYVGWILLFFGTPVMSVGHLVFAASSTLYILIAIVFEERDLMREFGAIYDDYRRRVPRLIPWRRALAPRVVAGDDPVHGGIEQSP